jgi:hypothetical protein
MKFVQWQGQGDDLAQRGGRFERAPEIDKRLEGDEFHSCCAYVYIRCVYVSHGASEFEFI